MLETVYDGRFQIEARKRKSKAQKWQKNFGKIALFSPFHDSQDSVKTYNDFGYAFPGGLWNQIHSHKADKGSFLLHCLVANWRLPAACNHSIKLSFAEPNLFLVLLS